MAKTTVKSTDNTILRPPWLFIARLIWLALVLTALVLFIAGTVDKFRQPLSTGCPQMACNPIELTSEDVALVQELGLSEKLFTVLLPTVTLLWNLSFLIVAFLIFSRRSNEWMALLLSATLAILGAVAFSPVNDVLLRTRPAWHSLIEWLETTAYVSLLLLFLIFPDGRFVPRWTFLVFIPLVIVFGIGEPPSLIALIFAIYLVVSIYAQVYRYRQVSDPLQRQQTKWVAFGLMGVAAIMGIWLFIATVFPAHQPTVARTYFLLFGLPPIYLIGLLFPVCVTIAVLRYRLWDVDLLINRTLVYGLLTGILALVYFGTVVLLQSVLRTLTGQEQSEIVTVISTLAIAGLFTPLRRRLQAIIDSRFYRRKYDAQKTLAVFAAAARDEVDVERLAGALVTAVEDTVQPAHVWLWLRPGGRV
jgi:hypothetical protein